MKLGKIVVAAGRRKPIRAFASYHAYPINPPTAMSGLAFGFISSLSAVISVAINSRRVRLIGAPDLHNGGNRAANPLYCCAFDHPSCESWV